LSNDFHSGSRSGYRAKRKKTNLILNSLIVIVLALIVIVAFSIFSSGEEKASSKNEPKTEEKQTTTKDDNAKENKEKQTEEKQSGNEDEDEDKKEEDSTSEEADDSEAIVTEGDGTSNVVKTVENPAWKPVGTEQTGAHNPVYDSASVDWQEMLKAISYATGLEQSTMTVYWLGRDQSTTNGSVGTVYSKETQEKYRVYIQWVDGKGWMPTKVEELSELER
jgi:cytoskeletal protein RodZ